jgi:hypothetical protein
LCPAGLDLGPQDSGERIALSHRQGLVQDVAERRDQPDPTGHNGYATIGYAGQGRATSHRGARPRRTAGDRRCGSAPAVGLRDTPSEMSITQSRPVPRPEKSFRRGAGLTR